MKSLALCLLLAACRSSSSPSPAPATPPPSNETPSPATPDPAPAANGPTLGQPCGDGDTCASGLACVKYYGIAGPRGPEFKSCEIRCKADDACPPAHRCVTIADGPGQVCRPAE
jgi:hypothetical protein